MIPKSSALNFVIVACLSILGGWIVGYFLNRRVK